MAEIADRNRKQRRLYRQERRENKAFSRFKKRARYGSKLHRQRISQGLLTRLYGRPIRGTYQRPKYKPRRVAGFHPKVKRAGVHYYRQRRKKRMARDGR